MLLCMEYEIMSHRFGASLVAEPDFAPEWSSLTGALDSISEEEIVECHTSKFEKSQKSLSRALNLLIKEKLIGDGWMEEPPLFNAPEYQGRKKYWRLDFARGSMSIEVAFNHGEALAWNLIKPVLASELNHVEKAIQTRLGIIILASRALKEAGGFDNAIGEFEKAMEYLNPLQNQLSCPLILIGLKAPTSFRIEVYKNQNGDNRGRVVQL
jgi:tetratricopeptide (TPR) repeat protein